MRPEKIAHLLTADEAFWLNPCERWELVEGRLVEMSPTKKRHGRIYAGDVGFILRRSPDTVRAPDVAFISRERLPAVEEETFSSVMPDLAVEILSPSDRWREIERKIAEYLQAGVTSVWAVDPSREELRVYRAGRASVTLGKGDQVEDPDLLPGLKLQVAALFSD